MPIVEVEGLHKSYGSKTVLRDVHFTVEEGEIFGILGPNGAGKTTAVECVEGLRLPDGGTVRVAGFDPQRDHREVTRILGVQLQESELQPKLTVREALEFYSALYPSPADWRLIAEKLGLEELLKQGFGQLSGGQKQRLFIALALVGRPKIAVFDELTTALDPRARRETWKLIEGVRDSGVTILLVTHFMEEAQHLCDRVAVFDRGQIVALDTPDGLIKSSASSTVITFFPSKDLPAGELRALPGLASLKHENGQLVINGTNDTVNAVISLLARNHVTVTDLRVVDATLDDAFLGLTGRGEDGEEAMANGRDAEHADTVQGGN